MERLPVSSSSISSIGYDPEQHILEVEFSSGAVYRYRDVSQDLYQRFISAESIGRFFESEIRNAGFVFERVI